jgi:leucyl/phenylalanyl-tRNA--protein transferase
VSVRYLEPGKPTQFPDPRHSDAGLVAVGGDLSVERLLLAYDQGIFPWYSEHEVPLWWSPDPRCILRLEDLHVPKRLQRTIQQGRFELSWNRAFEAVIRECARYRVDGTWIHEPIVEAYCALHHRGHAHSLEVWSGEQLVAGVYGVQRGGLFAAESKFHRQRDMSKVALVACARTVFAAGVELFDVQFLTPHLASLGTSECPRSWYLAELGRVRGRDLDLRAVEPRL